MIVGIRGETIRESAKRLVVLTLLKKREVANARKNREQVQITESLSTVDESKNDDMEVEETSKNDSSEEMDVSSSSSNEQ